MFTVHQNNTTQWMIMLFFISLLLRDPMKHWKQTICIIHGISFNGFINENAVDTFFLMVIYQPFLFHISQPCELKRVEKVSNTILDSILIHFKPFRRFYLCKVISSVYFFRQPLQNVAVHLSDCINISFLLSQTHHLSGYFSCNFSWNQRKS